MKFGWLLFSLVSSAFSVEENGTQTGELDFFQLPNIQKVFFEEVLKAKEIEKDVCLSQLKTLVLNVFKIKDIVQNPRSFLSEYRSKLQLIGFDRNAINFFSVFESWGKPPSGVTYGHLVDFGNYKECVDVSIHNNKSYIVGKYCLAKIPLNDYFHELTLENRVGLPKLGNDVDAPKTEPSIGPGFGICIPNACDEKTISNILGRALKLGKLKVVVNRCSTKETPQLEPLDYVFM